MDNDVIEDQEMLRLGVLAKIVKVSLTVRKRPREWR